MRLRCPSPTRSPAYEPWFWNIHWRQGETEEDSLGNQVWWLVGRALDPIARTTETLVGPEADFDDGDMHASILGQLRARQQRSSQFTSQFSVVPTDTFYAAF